MKKDRTTQDNYTQIKGRLKPIIKRIRTEPRQKIRQLLRGFLPLNEIRRSKQPGQANR